MAYSAQKLAKALIEQEQQLRSDRKALEAMWQTIARYVIPRSATFTEEVAEGVQRTRYILDSTAPRSLEMFASFLHTMLNNPASPWLIVRFLNPKLKDNIEAKRWCEENSENALALLASSNIYFYLHEAYIDLGAFGTAVLLIEVDRGELRTRSYHLMDCVIDENASGVVDTMHRSFKYTPRQAKQRWPGQNLGKSIMDAKGLKNHEKVDFMHSVFPITDATADMLPARVAKSGAPYASVWINRKDQTVVSIGTYEEFPYIVPRWYKVRGEKYGRSPAMTVMPDIRMVNRMTETVLRGAEKIVDPPLLLPDGGLVSPIRLFPGGLSFSDGQITPQPLIPPGASRIEVGETLLKNRQDAIRDGFFVPLFVTPDSPVKTATQVLQQTDERNKMVSPMLVRQQGELHEPLAERVFGIMARNRLLTPLPPALANEMLGIRYVSPLTAAQLNSEGLAILKTFEQISPWGQVDPGVFDRYDLDVASRLVADATGMPAAVIRDDVEMKKARALREQRQAQLVQQANLPAALTAGASLVSANAAQTKAEKS